MKMEKRTLLTLILTAIISAMLLVSFSPPVHAATAKLKIIPAANHFYANYTQAGTILKVNITVYNVTGLFTWQLGLQWNTALFSYYNISTPADNPFAGQPVIPVPPDTSNASRVVFGYSLFTGGIAFNGSRTLAQLELIVNTTVATVPAYSSISFEGLLVDTFLNLDSGLDIPFDATDSSYSYIYAIGDRVTHNITGAPALVITESNGTIAPNSVTVDYTNKSLVFTVNSTTGNTAFFYAILPKNVINATTMADWKVYVNQTQVTPLALYDNATYTNVLFEFTFGSPIVATVKGTWVIPELSNVLMMLMIASSAAMVVAKIKLKKK